MPTDQAIKIDRTNPGFRLDAALHEAAHAVVARVLGLNIDYVTLEQPADDDLAAETKIVMPPEAERDTAFYAAHGIVALAGRTIEILIAGAAARALKRQVSRQWMEAVQQAADVQDSGSWWASAWAIVPGDSAHKNTKRLRLLNDWQDEARRLVAQHQHAIYDLAEVLVERDRVDGNDLIDQALAGQLHKPEGIDFARSLAPVMTV